MSDRRIRNKERPKGTSFNTTEDALECAKILAAYQGISLSEFVHNAVCEQNKAILVNHWQISSTSEFLAQIRVPFQHQRSELASSAKV